jgi:hypothetical protein
MTDVDRYPRRDADGRFATAGDLLGVVLSGYVVGAVVLLAFEAVVFLLKLSDFGNASGWLTLILPAWVFVEEFRAADYGAYRVLVGLLGAGFALAGGMIVAGLLAPGLPPLVSGAAGAATFALAYSFIWFYGLRWLRHRTG